MLMACRNSKPRSMMKHQKLQSAMEYLMTYGWAILVIAVVLGVLYSLGIFNPSNFAPKAQPGSCQVFRPNGPGTSYDANLEGTCNGELPTYVAGFNGEDSLVWISSLNPKFYQNSVSYTGWIEVSGFNSSNGVQEWWSNTESNNAIGLQSYPNSYPGATSTGFTFFIHGGSSGNCHINGISMNKWYFVAETMNATTSVLYVSGQECSFTSGGAAGLQNDLTLGAYGLGYTGPGNDMIGYESNVQAYNTTLSVNAISALYSQGIGAAPVDPQYLIGWWPLNGNANDYSGNNNNGVPTNVIFTGTWQSGYTPP